MELATETVEMLEVDDPNYIPNNEAEVIPSVETSADPHPQASSQPLMPVVLPVSAIPSTDSGIIPKVHNVVCCVDLCCRLDLKKIAFRLRNAEYNPKRFHAVIMRIVEPKSSALIFQSGKIVVTGARSEAAAHLAARKYARLIQILGFNIKFKDFKIQNLVATCDVKFPVKIEDLYSKNYQFSRYEPELFPGLIFRVVKPRVVLLIFVSGKIVITGAKSRDDLKESISFIYPILKLFQKQ